MFKTDIEYSKGKLFVNLEGTVKKKNLADLRKKLFYIIGEYHINDVIISIQNTSDIEMESLYELLDEYDMNYGGRLELITS